MRQQSQPISVRPPLSSTSMSKRNQARRCCPFGSIRSAFSCLQLLHLHHIPRVIFAGDRRIFSSLLPRVFNSRPVFLLIAFFPSNFVCWKLQRVAGISQFGSVLKNTFSPNSPKRVNSIGATTLPSLQTYASHNRLPRCRPVQQIS
jgi:hypothetical protein